LIYNGPNNTGTGDDFVDIEGIIDGMIIVSGL
jgi:hypothetical protein